MQRFSHSSKDYTLTLGPDCIAPLALQLQLFLIRILVANEGGQLLIE